MSAPNGLETAMSYQPSTSHSPASRVSDAERDSAVEALTGHVSTGRLSIDDFDTRAARVYSAVTRADLTSVFDDLPQATDPEVSAKPVRRDHEIAAWAGVGVLCLVIWAVTSVATGGVLYFWPMWVIGPWGAMLALQRVTGIQMPTGCAGRRVYD
ncbi:hypothetical protein A3K89_24940 [Rhodococcoides kyotonense]|uniref:DUF1707 domain-containing protein n=2 Tax=Rhodococcoides kyotonense TaxID=398843 RepID=A0A177YAB6_9NOCA|nr:hypothetical protein A3K89_24940 [Rhodococcus kyotonensis]